MTIRHALSRYAIFVALALECLIVGLTTDTFFTSANLSNVLRQNAFIAILAAGMTFVILTGGIDLSVGSVVGLSGVVCAGLLSGGAGVFPAIAAGLGHRRGRRYRERCRRHDAPHSSLCRDVGHDARGARSGVQVLGCTHHHRPSPHVRHLSGGVPTAVIMIAVFATAWIVLSRTPLGRHVYAVGGNVQAAWLSGVRVTRVQMTVYATSGLTAGLAGVLVASRLNAGYPRAGEYDELDAIAAVVVGGTSLFGGRGSIWGTLAGAFFIGILNNALNLYQVSTYDQMIVKGVVLLGATSLDRWRET